MNIQAISQLDIPVAGAVKQSPDALRKAATQFEALLLMQLTSALSKSDDSGGDDGEDSLFGGDGGTGLAKQLFSEQLATTMAQSGGVGLANVIMRQFGGDAAKTAPGLKALSGVVSNIKDMDEAYSPATASGMSSFLVPHGSAASNAVFSGNADEVEVISTFEDQMRSEGIDDSMKNLVLDGRIVNTTRARLAPSAPIRLIGDNEPVDTPGVWTTPSYQLPVSGRLSSGFGNRFHPIDKKVKFHAGLDLAVPLGTPVDAAAGGTVSFAGWTDGYGNLVTIQHPDGRETRYGHLEKLLVSSGEDVTAGQRIALSGSTGKSTGPHVHFEIRENGEVVDPRKILAKGLNSNAER